jgi:hypothetical protein
MEGNIIRIGTVTLVLCWLVLVCGSATAVTIRVDASGDAWLPHESEQQANANFGSSEYLLTAAGATENNPGAGVIGFDLSGIPSDAIIESAVLTLHGSGFSSGQFFVVHRNTASWDESTITWNTRPTISADDAWIFLGDVGSHGLDLTSYVYSWVSGEYSSYGMTIDCHVSQPLEGPYVEYHTPTVYSRESADALNHPSLLVDYRVVPEPSALTALASGLIGVLTQARKRRRV